MGRGTIVFAALLVFSQTALSGASIVVYHDLNDFLDDTDSLTFEPFDAPWPVGVFPIPQPFANLGVSWSTTELLGLTTSAQVSPPAAISSADLFDGTTDQIIAVLPPGMTAAGGWVSNTGDGNDVQFTAFDATGGVLGSVVAPLAPLSQDEFRFVGIVSSTPIARVEFLSLQGEPNDDFAVDDFYFGVPEPATVSLVLIGVLGLRRRGRGASST